MILNFKTKFDKNKKRFPTLSGNETNFKEKILSKSKIHTIRFDPNNRWHIGDFIHMTTGSRTKNYNQFNVNIPELSFVKTIQSISIIYKSNNSIPYIFIQDKPLKFDQIVSLALHDGFNNLDDFLEWFNETIYDYKIIGWTDYLYFKK